MMDNSVGQDCLTETHAFPSGASLPGMVGGRLVCAAALRYWRSAPPFWPRPKASRAQHGKPA